VTLRASRSQTQSCFCTRLLEVGTTRPRPRRPASSRLLTSQAAPTKFRSRPATKGVEGGPFGGQRRYAAQFRAADICAGTRTADACLRRGGDLAILCLERRTEILSSAQSMSSRRRRQTSPTRRP